MYDELIKNLRIGAKCFPGYELYGYSKEPFRLMPEHLTQAADAIEELQKITTHYEEESKGWWLAACDAKEERERLKEQISKWIPVTERLPEDRQRVLAIEPLLTKPKTTYYRIVYFSDNLESVDSLEFDGKNRCGFYYYDSDYGFCEADGITHWMPLPEPPEEET